MSLCLDTVAPGVANEKKLQQEAIDDLINTIDSEVKSPEAGVVLCGDFNHLPTKALIPPRSKTGWQKQDLWRLHDWSDQHPYRTTPSSVPKHGKEMQYRVGLQVVWEKGGLAWCLAITDWPAVYNEENMDEKL